MRTTIVDVNVGLVQWLVPIVRQLKCQTTVAFYQMEALVDYWQMIQWPIEVHGTCCDCMDFDGMSIAMPRNDNR